MEHRDEREPNHEQKRDGVFCPMISEMFSKTANRSTHILKLFFSIFRNLFRRIPKAGRKCLALLRRPQTPTGRIGHGKACEL